MHFILDLEDPENHVIRDEDGEGLFRFPEDIPADRYEAVMHLARSMYHLGVDHGRIEAQISIRTTILKSLGLPCG